jgi:hypothetical protein
MSDAQVYDITVRPNEAWVRALYLKLRDGTPVPTPGFTAVMVIYDGNDVLFTSTGEVADIQLTPQAGGESNRLDILLGQDLTGSLLVPFGARPNFWYRLDLVDDGDSANVIPLLVGTVTVARRYGR